MRQRGSSNAAARDPVALAHQFLAGEITTWDLTVEEREAVNVEIIWRYLIEQRIESDMRRRADRRERRLMKKRAYDRWYNSRRQEKQAS